MSSLWIPTSNLNSGCLELPPQAPDSDHEFVRKSGCLELPPVTAHAAMATMIPCDTQNRSDKFYWEHLGMLSVPSYREAWERKRQWYEDNGFLDRVITSEDGADVVRGP